MSRLSYNHFRIRITSLSALRDRLESASTATIERYPKVISWRYSERSLNSAVTVIAYRTGAIVVSGHGDKFDLVCCVVRSYDLTRGKAVDSKGSRRK